MSKTMAEVLADKLAELDELTDGDGFTYSWFDMEKIDLAEELMLALSAAGFGLVADAKAEALREAAEHFKQRSDTLHNTMLEMTASKEYGLEDIVRYGAYSAEANGAATWLRTAAAKAAS